jgi:hypothetical protein
VIQSKPGKVLQYQHLTRGIQHMCNVTDVKPLIIGAIETIPKTFRQTIIISSSHRNSSTSSTSNTRSSSKSSCSSSKER